MKANNRIIFSKLLIVAIITVLAAGLFVFTGCSSEEKSAITQTSAGTTSGEPTGKTIKVGTMPTEDFLPMWVAEQEGYFDEFGVRVENVVFDSAPALSAAIASGDVNMAMVDVMRAVKLCESGSPVDIEWVTLGQETDQGIFGVLAPADAKYNNLKELAAAVAEGDPMAKQGVGLAANTIPEYVYDMLCKQAGVDAAAIPTQEVASLPERFSLTASGKLAAAALPNSMLELGKVQGMKILADDSTGDNISQSVMVARSVFASENRDSIIAIAKAWDKAAAKIGDVPQNQITLLASKANLNEAVIDTYSVCIYPQALSDGKLVRISENYVLPLLTWMKSKDYLSKDATYDEATGTFELK